MKTLILGSGPAAVFAVEAIRRRDSRRGITMVSKDRSIGRSPVITTYWLAQPWRVAEFRDANWAHMQRVEARTGCEATALDTKVGEVLLKNGEKVPYDQLLIATGSSPVRLPLPGMEARGVHTLRTIEDSRQILGEGAEVKKVVVMGGGFVGLKLACHLKERGLEVLLVEKETVLGGGMLDRPTSLLIQEKLLEKGVTVETSAEVIRSVAEKGWVREVVLRDGRAFSCQRVVQTLGVQPNVGFLEGSGVDVDGGILVNACMETNCPGIYAAGDVVMSTHAITSERFNNATWAAATQQGRTAGENMAGGNRRVLQSFPFNTLQCFDLHVASAGLSAVEGGGEIAVVKSTKGKSYQKLVFRDERLVGFILAGDTQGAGFLLSLIRKGLSGSGGKWPGPFRPGDRRMPYVGYGQGCMFQ